MKQIILTEGLDGRYYVDMTDGESTYPKILYRTSRNAIARVMQLLDIKEPVAPQDHPERVCIGEIETEIDD
jgi:hypothetical protein